MISLSVALHASEVITKVSAVIAAREQLSWRKGREYESGSATITVALTCDPRLCCRIFAK